MKMHSDNQVALHTASNPMFHDMTKHKNWLSFYLRQVVQRNMHWVYQITWSTCRYINKILERTWDWIYWLQAGHMQLVCVILRGSVRISGLKILLKSWCVLCVVPSSYICLFSYSYFFSSHTFVSDISKITINMRS